jgi:hypothetical protein
MQAGLTGGATTGTVSIVDNVLLRLDESIRLKSRAGTPVYVSGGPTNSPVVGSRKTDKAGGRQPGGGYAAQKVDPNDVLTSGNVTTPPTAPTASPSLVAGTVTSQFSNTFSQADVGKYVRIPTNPGVAAGVGPFSYWVQIQKIDGTATDGKTAKHSNAVQMVSNYNTGNFVLTNEARSATVKSYRSGSTPMLED